MKLTLLTILGLLFCTTNTTSASTNAFLSYEDSIPNTAIFLKNRKVIYQKVFISNLKKEDLADKVATLLTTMKDFKFNRGNHFSDWEFFGRLSDHKFDLGKFDTGIFSTPGTFSFPMHAQVVVQVKDNRYRITISDIVFRLPKDETRKEPSEMIFDDAITKNRRTLNQSKSNIKIASMLDQYLTELFDLEKSITGNDF